MIDVDKIDIDRLKNVRNNFTNLKSKVDKLYFDKLVPVPVDLSKLSDVVKNDVVKKDICNAKIENNRDKIPDFTYIATTTVLTAGKNKRPNVSNLVKRTIFNTKIIEM